MAVGEAYETEKRIQTVRETIRKAAQEANRVPEQIHCIAVTKYHETAETLPLWEAGIKDWGENRVQELLRKVGELKEIHPEIQPRWHLIGTLQKNKIKYLPGLVYRIHSVDSLPLAQALAQSGANQNWTPAVLLQVNVSGEDSKHGFSPDQLRSTWDDLLLCTPIRYCGLMTMTPRGASSEESLFLFNQLVALAKELREVIPDSFRARHPLDELSMGMSQDYVEGIRAGATWVRLGTALLGPPTTRSTDVHM